MFSFDYVKDFDPEVAKAMEDELGRQRNNLELIASENLVSEAVMAAMGSHLTNKFRRTGKHGSIFRSNESGRYLHGNEP